MTMKTTKMLLGFGLLAVSAIGLSACEPSRSVSNLPPGEYQSDVKSTNANGTTIEKKSKTKVQVDEYGRKKATQETETTRDPEGMFNKETTSKSKTTIDQQ